MKVEKSKNVLDSIGFALRGIALIFSRERNLRIHCVIAVVVVVLALFLGLSTTEWAIIIVCIVIMLFAEMVNSALEYHIDFHVGDDFSHLAKDVKDVAAGSVLVCAAGISIVGMIIFLPKLLKFFHLFQ